MTTRPGYVWDNTASEWVTIGPVALPGSTVFYQASAPSSPATGDIWIDSDDDVPSVDSSVFYRWKETAVGGETTLSGNDDNGLALKYTPGYEELYINGVLQVRGSDYVATTGTTITGLTALVAGDIVTVMSQVAYTVGDTYTQTAADAKFVNKNVGGLNLVVPTSVTGGTVSANGQVTIGSAVSSVTVNGAFSSAHDNYLVQIVGGAGSASTNCALTLGSASTGYYSAGMYTLYTSATVTGFNTNNGSSFGNAVAVRTSNIIGEFKLFAPNLAKTTGFETIGIEPSTDGAAVYRKGFLNDTTQHTSFTLTPGTGTLTGGTIRIYGYNNGA